VGNCVCRTTGNRHPYNANRVASEFVPVPPQGANAPAVVLSGGYAGEEGFAQLSSPISKVWREMARVVKIQAGMEQIKVGAPVSAESPDDHSPLQCRTMLQLK
jgi:hypothetical protein